MTLPEVSLTHMTTDDSRDAGRTEFVFAPSARLQDEFPRFADNHNDLVAIGRGVFTEINRGGHMFRGEDYYDILGHASDVIGELGATPLQTTIMVTASFEAAQEAASTVSEELTFAGFLNNEHPHDRGLGRMEEARFDV